MAKNQYQLHLKGYVGSWDFDSSYVDYVLSQNEGKEVAVLIDSPGGQLSTALSISAAFRRHGNVCAHFVGMNASAATIASMGARRITMDSSAMYLVHQCALPFFEYGSLNATGMEQLIESLAKAKTDLEKMDANVASMYAARCRKEPSALLALMKTGGWLSAKEALDWGFVDELTDFDDEAAPVLTASLAADFQAYGIPLPNVPQPAKAVAEDGFFQRLAQTIASVFKSSQPISQHNLPRPMNKVFKNICKSLAIDALPCTEGCVQLSDEQADTVECALQAGNDMIAQLSLRLKQAEDENKALAEANKSLEAKLASLPAAATTSVVDDKKQSTAAEPTAFELFLDAGESAKELFNRLP